MTKWGERNGIEFWTMPPERASEGLEVLRAGFFQDESFCGWVGIDKDLEGQGELEQLSLASVTDCASIMAVDKETGTIAGVSFNKIQTTPPPGQKSFFEEFRDSRCKTKTAKALIDQMLAFDSLVDVLGKYNATCNLEIMFIATHPNFRKRGVAIGCVEYSLALGATLQSPKPTIATAIFTSPYSIRVGRTLNFDEIIHVPMTDHVYEGKRFLDVPQAGKNHPGCIVMAKML